MKKYPNLHDGESRWASKARNTFRIMEHFTYLHKGPPVFAGSMAQVNVRYMVRDVDTAVDFYTNKLGFKLLSNASPAFADVLLGDLRLLLAGPTSSAGRPMPDGRIPEPGGWNRIELIVQDIEAEVARLRKNGVRFRNDVVRGPGGAQILIEDPSGNVVELFQPASKGA